MTEEEFFLQVLENNFTSPKSELLPYLIKHGYITMKSKDGHPYPDNATIEKEFTWFGIKHEKGKTLLNCFMKAYNEMILQQFSDSKITDITEDILEKMIK